MNDDHVRPEELVAARHHLEDHAPEMDDELEIQIGDPAARVALT